MAYLKPFNINGNDIQFLLDQINFRPLFRMVNGQLQVVIAWDGTGAIFDQWGNPLWDGIAGALTPAQAMGQFGTSYANVNDASGLRQVSGDFNNLQPGQQHWGAVDQPFERMVKADYSHYVSSSIAGYVSGAPAAGLIAPVDSSHPMADAAAAAIALAGLDTSHQNTANTTTVANVASTYAVPGFPGLTIDTVDRTTKLSNTTTTFFDGHHVKANWGETASSVTTTADTYYVAANGAETNLTNTAAVTSTESTGPKISGGELDAAYHGQLRAFDPLNPQNYVAGLERNTDGSVNVTNAANFDYTVSFANTTTSTPTMHSVIDYTPRMISQLIASGGVVTLKDADGHRVDWNPGLYNATSGTPTEQSSYKALIDNWNLAHAAGTAGHIDLTKLVEGAAIVTDYGMVGQSGGQDTQNPNSSDIYIGSANPGIAATNGIFTLFGQFFDHGLDFIGKGSQYKIIIPLAVDDPLYGVTGADGNPTTSITITRATVSGQDANGNATYLNHTSPYIDQSQTYGSADTVTNILREWVKDPNSPTHYIAGASLLDGQTMKTWTDANGNDTTKTLPTLAELRAHIDATGRDALTWEDVAGDLRPRDASGHVIAGGSGQPLLLDMNPHIDATHIKQSSVDALNTAAGLTGTDAITLASLNVSTLIAHGWINPANFSITVATTSPELAALHAAVGNVLMDSVSDHYIAGDGRANENFGLTAIHHVFHEEHGFQVANLEAAVLKQGAAVANQWQVAVSDGTGGHYTDANGNYTLADHATVSWNQDKVFQGAKLVVEMEYQHTAIDQYARAVTPNLEEFVGTDSGQNAAVTLEYAQSAFRFGHSQLRETIDTMDPSGGLTGKVFSYALEKAFLNPADFAKIGAGSIVMGMERQQSNEIDEFVTPSLQQGLLGQPMDLASINIARGRDLGIATLNQFRAALGDQKIGDHTVHFAAYANWNAFKAQMIHPANLVNFIAAYSLDGDVAHAKAIIDAEADKTGAMHHYIDKAGADHTVSYQQAFDFLNKSAAAGGDSGVDKIDLWIGGLAEVHISGGVLGETFDAIFLSQMTKLMNNDRLYYLSRLVNQQFGDEIINEQFKDIIERNTGTTHLNGNIFGYADQYYEVGKDASTLAAAGAEHKYGQIIAAYASANGHGIGVYMDGGASTLLSNGTLYTDPAIGGGQTYVFDARPDQTFGVNPDGTNQSGHDSSEVIVGTAYNDYIKAGSADDTVYGDAGDDIIFGGGPSTPAAAGGASAGLDHLYGGDGNDTIYGEDMPDLIDGGNGDDLIFGGSSGASINGTDQLVGAAGNDTIYGDVGIDKIYGGTGDDNIYGGQDTDPFSFGGDGNDYINGDAGQDINYGGNGSDILDGGTGIDLQYGDNGDDILRRGDGDSGVAGNGGGGDDLIGGDGVTDTGFDLADWSQQSGAAGFAGDLTQQFTGALPKDLTPLIVNGVLQPFTTTNIIFQMEGLVGSKNNDQLRGDSAADAGAAAVSHGDNWLIGGSGDDLLEGRGGNDVIVGGSITLQGLIGTYADSYTSYVDGASHHTAATAVLSGGFLDKASTAGVTYAKHFTELLKSEAYKDYVLGDTAGLSNGGGTDTMLLSGNRRDYAVVALDVNGGVISDANAVSNLASVYALRVTDKGSAGRTASDGTDLVIGVDNFQFADGIKTLAQLFNNKPTGSVGFVAAETPNNVNNNANAVRLTGRSSLFDLDNASLTNVLGAVAAGAITTAWRTVPDAAVSTTASNTTPYADNQGRLILHTTAGTQINEVASYTDANGTLETVSKAWNMIVGVGSGNATAQNNTLTGTDSLTISDAIFGLAGNDSILGKAGDDQLYGGAGSDTLNGGTGNDNLVGGNGTDTAVYSGTVAEHTFSLSNGNLVISDTLANRDGIDTVSSIERLQFGATIYNLNFGTNAVSNTLLATSPPELFIGFGATNTVSYQESNAVTANLAVQSTNAGGAAGDVYVNIQNLTGSGDADRLTGDANANALSGGGGNDTIIGGAGNDTISGGTGRDAMTGDAGNDWFVFTNTNNTGNSAATRDIIVDFVHGTDKINLSGIDAISNTNFNDTFIWDNLATDANGNHLRGHVGYHQEQDANNNWLTIIEGNTNSNNASHNFQIALLGQVALDAGDFSL